MKKTDIESAAKTVIFTQNSVCGLSIDEVCEKALELVENMDFGSDLIKKEKEKERIEKANTELVKGVCVSVNSATRKIIKKVYKGESDLFYAEFCELPIKIKRNAGEEDSKACIIKLKYVDFHLFEDLVDEAVKNMNKQIESTNTWIDLQNDANEYLQMGLSLPEAMQKISLFNSESEAV